MREGERASMRVDCRLEFDSCRMNAAVVRVCSP